MSDNRSLAVSVKLAVMMFLQFLIWGAWYVTAPNYLSTIGFTGADFGWTYAVGPLAGMISPFFVGMIADRFFPAQRVLSVLHLIGGGIMLYATTLMTGANPSPSAINWMFFGHMLTFYPTLALTNTLAMKHMTNPEKQFPIIRVFGTIGWITAGLLLTFLTWETTINMFYLSGGAGIALGIYSLFLPHTPPASTGKVSAREIMGLDALVLLKNRSFLIFIISSMLICIPLAFYYQIASRVVETAALPIGSTMSFGQMSEVGFMVIMPFFFARLGIKKMLAIGMAAWVLRYTLFAFGAPSQISWMIIIGILLHGICYDFFFVTGQIYTDQAAPKSIRAQAQGMLVFFTLGLGMFIGAKIAGIVETQHTPEASLALKAQVESVTAEIASVTEAGGDTAALTEEAGRLRLEELKAVEWKPLWLKPAGFAAAVLLIFLMLFRNPPRQEEASSYKVS